jgi:predicted HTH domain antitoxin
MDAVKSLRVPAEILQMVRDCASRRSVDESTAMRQFMREGALDYVVDLYKRGDVTLGEAARLASATPRDLMEVMWARGVQGNLTLEQELEGHETMRRLRRQGLV